MLAAQLDAGRFARGLWYFFGIVTTAGIFAGIAGLGLGVAAGLLWEQIHRHRRADRNKGAVPDTPDAPPSPAVISHHGPESFVGEQPRLQLVPDSPAPLPNLTGRRIASVRFTAQAVELDFGGLRVAVRGTTRIICGLTQHVYPEPGSRDALCSLIGTRVERMRAASAEGVEVMLDNGCLLMIPRAGAAVA